jgi:hypothetical protein
MTRYLIAATTVIGLGRVALAIMAAPGSHARDVLEPPPRLFVRCFPHTPRHVGGSIRYMRDPSEVLLAMTPE